MDLIALGAFLVLIGAWVVLPLGGAAVEKPVELEEAA
jgi:hypothetical protein